MIMESRKALFLRLFAEWCGLHSGRDTNLFALGGSRA